MRSLKIRLKQLTPSQSTLIVDCLNRGQVLALPTDTIYGLSCRADDARAVNRIKAMKGGAKDKPLSVLMFSEEQLKKYCYLSQRRLDFIRTVRAGRRPVTFILPYRGGLSRVVVGNSRGLGVRLPKSRFLRKILRASAVPLVSTSLNQSGQANFSVPRRLPPNLQPDLVVDAGEQIRPASLIWDLRGREFRILRK